MSRRTEKDLRELRDAGEDGESVSESRAARFTDHGWMDGEGTLTDAGERLQAAMRAFTPSERFERVIDLWGVPDFVDCALGHPPHRVQELASLSLSIEAVAEECLNGRDWGIGENPPVRQITPVAPSMGTVLDSIHVHTESANHGIAKTLIRELQKRDYQIRRTSDSRVKNGKSNYKFNVGFPDEEAPSNTS